MAIHRAAKNLHDPANGPLGARHRPGLMVAGHFRQREPYRVVRPRGTDDWLLTFTLAGRGRYRMADVEHAARPGDLLLLAPGAHHDYGCVPREWWHFLWVHFLPRPDWLQHLDWRRLGPGLCSRHVPNARARARLKAAFLRCLAEAQAAQVTPEHLADELAMNALEEVLLLAARHGEAGGEGERGPASARTLSPEIRAVLEHLSANLARPHSIAELARVAKLSPSRFAHRFKTETGDAVIACLLKLRLRQAARLLAFSGLRVQEVAQEVGFESPYYFSRQFTRHFGMSPRAFRRRGDAEAAFVRSDT